MRLRSDNHDITVTAGNLTWTNTIAELATKMSFELPKIDAQYTKIYLPGVGSAVGLDMGPLGRVFQGTVVALDDGDKNVNKYTVVDDGWHLNKDKFDIQFNSMALTDAIRAVEPRIDTIIGVEGAVTEVYLDKTKAEVLKDLLEKAREQTGYAFNFDMTPRGLRVYRLGDLHARPTFRLSPNTEWRDSVAHRGDVSHSYSIEDAPKETYSFTLIDDMDSYIRAGEELVVDGTTFIIQSAEHSVKDGWHFVKVGVERAHG